MSSPVLVGRSGQLSALDTALAAAGRGSPSAVIVGGEAGVGKSRLVSEFAERSRGAGARVLIGGCLELGAEGLPFAPFTFVLRGLVRDLGVAGVAELLPGGASRELARLLPEFGEPAGPDGAGEARARLFEQMLLLLAWVLELWEQVPDAAQRIGADHVAVLEETVRAAELAGEDDRGIMLAQTALREIDPAAEPVRAALLLETRGRLKYHLGRADYTEDLRAAVQLVPADPPSAARAQVLESLAHRTLYVHGGWADPELRGGCRGGGGHRAAGW